jgi:hypothetical protein
VNRFSVGAYSSELQVAAVRAGRVVWLVAFGWVAMPFGLASLLHPGDVINLHYVLQGEAKHKLLTAQQMGVGFVETIFALGVLLLLQLVGVVLFYRRAAINGARIATPALWPVAALLPGVVGNALWFVCLGYFDVSGFVIGMVPSAIAYGAERLCEQLGRDFVFGRQVAGLH